MSSQSYQEMMPSSAFSTQTSPSSANSSADWSSSSNSSVLHNHNNNNMLQYEPTFTTENEKSFDEDKYSFLDYSE